MFNSRDVTIDFLQYVIELIAFCGEFDAQSMKKFARFFLSKYVCNLNFKW